MASAIGPSVLMVRSRASISMSVLESAGSQQSIQPPGSGVSLHTPCWAGASPASRAKTAVSATAMAAVLNGILIDPLFLKPETGAKRVFMGGRVEKSMICSPSLSA